MKPLVLLVHGFNVWDAGLGSVGKLRPFFAEQGLPYIMVTYGHFGLLQSRFKNDKIATIIVRAIRNADRPVICVGHSNGCAIIQRASRNISIDSAVFINPALKPDISLASIGHVDVWHSPSDKAVTWSKWLPASNARPWGEMGATGADPRDNILNIDKENGFKVSSSAHSDVFQADKLAFFGPRIVSQALEQVVVS